MLRRLMLLAPVCLALFAGSPKPPDLPLINRLHELVLVRFITPLPGTFGMSRVAVPSSMGKHSEPRRTAERDFLPENPAELAVIGKLEENGVQAGIYVFGTAVVKAPPQALDYRALKGPGVVTRGTPRPTWYPGADGGPGPADTLPDWNAVYPLARRAMQSFEKGGTGFDTTLDRWDIAARPVAAEARCQMCHSDTAWQSGPIGGVLYAYRRAGR